MAEGGKALGVVFTKAQGILARGPGEHGKMRERSKLLEKGKKEGRLNSRREKKKNKEKLNLLII